jgi:death-on-curing protein
MRYLTAEEILILHARVVDATGGSHGVRDVELIKSIVHKPQATFGGEELYKGAFTKASVLLETLVNYHVFIDGNKRTGFIAAARFLFVNGYKLMASNAEAEEFVVGIATKQTRHPGYRTMAEEEQ